MVGVPWSEGQVMKLATSHCTIYVLPWADKTCEKYHNALQN